MKRNRYWLSIVSGVSLVFLVFMLGWTSSSASQDKTNPADRIALNVTGLVGVDGTLSRHYMLSSDSILGKDSLQFISRPSSQLPKKVQLASRKKYLILDDDIVFFVKGTVEDDIVFSNMGIVDDDIVFLNLSEPKDSIQASLPQGTGLQWDEISLQDTTLQLINTPFEVEEPDYVFARDLSFTMIDQQYLTIMGFRYNKLGKAEKGLWKFKLSELNGLYKPKTSEHLYGQWKELWIYKK